jgi:hypothetical protein
MDNQKHSIAEYLSYLGAALPQQGHGWRKIKCPFHQDSHASAGINFDEQRFKCHGCGVSGDVYDLIMEREGGTYIAFLLQATETYKASIHLGKDYLASRGLSVEEVQRFHLGVVEHPLPGHEGYTGRLAIPYVTPSGVVDIRFRTMSGGDPKYMGMPGAKTTMFNSQAVLTADGYICHRR